MIIFYTTENLKNHLDNLRKEKKSIGFAPTMGALHEGHISLIAIAKNQCDIVVCSIFVNPTQFNDLKDLEKYPRTLDADVALLKKANCDILFAPEVSEIYTEEELNKKKNNIEDTSWMNGKHVDFGTLATVMEGKLRPGHFNGVAQVVSKLFRIVKPSKAFFGQKDFQQLTIIRSMAKQLNMKIDIIACPIIRESDGLAMSSRNRRLSPKERKHVAKISTLLFAIKDIHTSIEVKVLKKIINNDFEDDKIMKLEYFEIVDADTLQPIDDLETTKARSAVACIAVKLKNVRLIDNIILF